MVILQKMHLTICSMNDGCRPTLETFLGYTKEDAYNLCPQRTLNDIPCKTYTSRFPNHLDRCKDEF